MATSHHSAICHWCWSMCVGFLFIFFSRILVNGNSFVRRLRNIFPLLNGFTLSDASILSLINRWKQWNGHKHSGFGSESEKLVGAEPRNWNSALKLFFQKNKRSYLTGYRRRILTTQGIFDKLSEATKVQESTSRDWNLTVKINGEAYEENLTSNTKNKTQKQTYF